jgi:hypothetical protein
MSVLRYTPGVYRYNPACQCDYCAGGGDNPPPMIAEARAMMVSQGGSFCYGEPHIPPNTRAPWAPS